MITAKDNTTAGRGSAVGFGDGFPPDAAVGILHCDGRLEWVFEIGTDAPSVRRRINCSSDQELKAGDPDAALRFPIVRGAGRARHSVYGTVVMRAGRLSEDLPAGSRVVLGIRLGADHRPSVTIYLPESGEVIDDALEVGQAGAVAEPGSAGELEDLQPSPEPPADDEPPAEEPQETQPAAAVQPEADEEPGPAAGADDGPGPAAEAEAEAAESELVTAAQDPGPVAGANLKAEPVAVEPPVSEPVAVAAAVPSSPPDHTTVPLPVLEFSWAARDLGPYDDEQACKPEAVRIYRTGRRTRRSRPGRRLAFLAVAAACCIPLGLAMAAPAYDWPAQQSSAATTVAGGFLTDGAQKPLDAETAAIKASLRAAAVRRGIPPEILYAIAYAESRWTQFDEHGAPLVSPDGGIGIMQVTSSGGLDVDVKRLRSDLDYNIAAGTDLLLAKRAATPVIGDGGQQCYENWFYAVWAYNGWIPENPYPHVVWEYMATGPHGWWEGVPATPVHPSLYVNGLGTECETPQPVHMCPLLTAEAPKSTSTGSP